MLRISSNLLFWILFGSFFLALPAYAEEIYLKNGDRISGEFISADDAQHTIRTESMGDITIKQEAIDRVVKDAKDLPLASKDKKKDSSSEKESEKSKKEKLWNNEIALGYDRKRGNTDASELNGRLAFHRKLDHEDRKNEFNLQGDAYYSEQNRKMNSRKYHAMTRYAYSFGETLKWYNFYKFEGDNDRFANIEYRLTPSTGFGYWFWDEERIKLLTETGLGVERTNYYSNKESQTELILIPRLYFEKIFFKETKISQDFTVYPSLTDPGHYRLRSESVLENPLSSYLSLRFILLDEYNSDPGGAAKKNDLRITSSLVFKY